VAKKCVVVLTALVSLAAWAGSAGADVDLDVVFVERDPLYWRYDIVYNPPGYNPQERPGTEDRKQWPDPGETVTFTAHVINKGDSASGPFGWRWIFDGQVVDSGQEANLSAGAEFTAAYDWTWETEWDDHATAFEVDYDNAVQETCEANNKVEDPTNALSFKFHVEQTTYDWFNQHSNGMGSQSWEDWAQLQVGFLNRLMADAVYPLTPEGALERVRLDSVEVHPDGTLPDWGTHAPDDWNWDGRWGFTRELIDDGFYVEHPEYLTGPEWSLMHELGHQLGLIDLYQLDIWDVSTDVYPGEIDFSCSRQGALMHTVGPYMCDHTARALNRNLHKRRGYYGDFLFDIPADNYLRILDGNRNPIESAEVSIWQAQDRYIYNPPDYHGFTDAGGLFALGSAPFGDINVVGSNSVCLVRVDAYGQTDYEWYEILQFNLGYWSGQTDRFVHEVQTQIFPAGAPTDRDLHGVAMASPNLGWAVGDSGRILEYNGSEWTQAASPTGMHLYSIDAASGDDAWAVGLGGTVVHFDGGEWTQEDPFTNRTLRSVCCLSDQGIWVAGDSGTVYKTPDGGGSWTQSTSGTSNTINAISFGDSAHGAIGGTYGTLRYTADGGQTWHDSVHPNYTVTDICFSSDLEAYAATDFGVILKTEDGGAVWDTFADFGYPNPFYGVCIDSEGRGWAVGQAQWQYMAYAKRFDGDFGQWHTQMVYPEGEGRKLNAVSLVSGNRGWAVGDDATLVYLADTDFVRASPDLLWPGWNWVSIPYEPTVGTPDDVFGFGIGGHLWRWDRYAKAPVAYVPPFATFDLEPGHSYLVLLDSQPERPVSYVGIEPETPFEFKMGRMGWTWVGMPSQKELTGDDFMNSVRVRFPSDAGGEERTAAWDYASVPNNWISWGWAFWDSEHQYAQTFTPYAPFGNRACRPWVGYRVWVQTGQASNESDPDQVTLVWPRSQ
jgi:photosystem II stability/assembly factor-like uncharacterized protein